MILYETSVPWTGISNVNDFYQYMPERANTCAMELTIRLQWVMLLEMRCFSQWVKLFEMRHLWDMIPSSQVTSPGVYTLQRMHVIITYAETFEYYIKKRGGGR